MTAPRTGLRKPTFASWAARLRPSGEIGAMVVTFAVLRTITVVHAPIWQPDTGTYLHLNFLGEAGRLWTVPLVWTIFPANDLREGVQLLFGIVSWSVLAVSVGRAITGAWTRRVAVAVVLIFGLLPQIAGWDPFLLSESIATSLLALLVGLLVSLSRRPSPRLVVGCLVVVTLWMFTRQVNALMFLIVLPLIIAFTIWRGPRRYRIAIVAALLLIGFWGGWAIEGPSSGSGGVWKLNAVQILEERISPNPQALQFFYAHGLPRSRAILAAKGTTWGSSSPILADRRVMRWISNHFQRTWLAYLLKDLPRTVGLPVVHFIGAVSGTSWATARTVLPSVVSQELWNPSIIFWFLTAVALVLGAYVRGFRIRGAPMILLLAITAVVGAIITWNTSGDVFGSEGYARQSLPLAVMFRLAVVLTIFFSVDVLRLRGRAKPARSEAERRFIAGREQAAQTLDVV